MKPKKSNLSIKLSVGKMEQLSVRSMIILRDNKTILAGGEISLTMDKTKIAYISVINLDNIKKISNYLMNLS